MEKVMELTCGNCKHENPAESAFCNRCGRPLADQPAKKSGGTLHLTSKTPWDKARPETSSPSRKSNHQKPAHLKGHGQGPF